MDEEYQRMAANSIAHEAFCAGQAWQQAAAAQERPCVLWKPSLYRDGNQWCALLGENIQDGVVGFGDSPDAAMWAFDEAWCEKLPPAPGAQPAPSEKDEPIRKAWARFSNALHRSPDAPYPGMSEAFEKHFSQSFTDREWRAESATWAAAWKAAKRHEAQAQPAPSIPEGWKLVPIEPTQEMRDAWELAPVCEYADAVFRCAYREMLAAAPEAKP